MKPDKEFLVFLSVTLVAVIVLLAACTHRAQRTAEAGSEMAKGEDDGGPPEAGTIESPGSDVVPIMHAKLGYTHALLDAIALRDFLQIEASAMALVDLSEASDWQVHDTVSYRIFSERFREAADDVAMQAQGEDIDAVSRAYVRLTMSCVDCHSYLRKEKMTKDMPGRVTWRE